MTKWKNTTVTQKNAQRNQKQMQVKEIGTKAQQVLKLQHKKRKIGAKNQNTSRKKKRKRSVNALRLEKKKVNHKVRYAIFCIELLC